MVVFMASAVALTVFVSWSAKLLIEKQIKDLVEAEAGGLSERYRERGVPGMTELIAERLRQDTERRGIYLMLAPDGSRLAGNIYGWPAREPDGEGWVIFTGERIGGQGPQTEVLARTYSLAEGYDLLVGRSMADARRLGTAINHALGWGLALTFLLGVAGAVFSTRQLGKRVDSMSRTASRIVGGDMKSRMGLSGSGDEYDQLARSFNEMMDEIEHLVEGVRTVTDNVAHDLRTPLNRLRSRVEMALTPAGGRVDYHRVLEETLADIDHMLATFNALLAISQAETGARLSPFQVFDLDVVARDVAELYEPLAEDKGARLTFTAQSGATVSGDRHLLFQITANLVDNAVKYTPPGGAIRMAVTVDAEGGAVVLCIGDSGPGIPPEHRERVLERFVRLDATRSTPGNGLGLSLVRAVAALHNASLSLGDNHPGLLVTLTLPLAQVSAAATPV